MPLSNPPSLFGNTVLGTGYQTDTHSEMHGRALQIWENVQAYGAVGDGVVDDTAAIQAAIDTVQAAQRGTVYFPPGSYKISAPLTVGDGSTASFIVLQGPDTFAAANISGIAELIQVTPNTDGIRINAPGGTNHSYIIRGLRLLGAEAPPASLGTGINCAFGGQTSAVTLESCSVAWFGVGINVGNSVNTIVRRVTTIVCMIGMTMGDDTPGGGANLPSLENVYFQSCTTAGLSITGGWVTSGRFDSCVFQSNTGPGLLIDTDSALDHAVFTNCWWEFPGTDMIRLTGNIIGRSLYFPTFIGCHMDGSGNNRHFIRATGSATEANQGIEITMIGCFYDNAGTGDLWTTDTDPTNSTDPGFIGGTIIGGKGGDVKGVHTSGSSVTSSLFITSHSMEPANLITSSVYSIKPRYVMARADVGQFNTTKLGFFGATAITKPTAYTQTYATADKTLSAYTPDAESAAYTGAADTEAKLADLNALRVAYENLRAFTEDLAQQHNSLIDDLQALGLVS